MSALRELFGGDRSGNRAGYLGGRGRKAFDLQAYHDSFQSRDLSDGDKIVVHSDVLNEIMKSYGQRNLPEPLIFKITNIAVGRISHCGVLEFTSDKNTHAYLPRWMMENLALADGSQIRLNLMDDPLVPAAKRIVFQPLQPSKFAKIPSPDATLQHALRKFTTVTQGDTIMVKHATEEYELTVLEVHSAKQVVFKPPVVRVVNTEVSCEFVSMPEKSQEEEKVEVLTIGEPHSDVVNENASLFFRVKLGNPSAGVRMKLSSSAGDPVIRISTKSLKPSAVDCSWHATCAKGETKQITIEPKHPQFSKTWYNMSVQGYKGSASFTVLAEQDSGDKEEEKRGEIMGRVTSGTDPDARKCDNCWSFIPRNKFDMHTMSCARNNWRCGECGEVMRPSKKDQHTHCPQCKIAVDKDQLQKHIDLAHSTMKCECGEVLATDVYELHRKESCPLRPTMCKFCKAMFPNNASKEHEAYCGSKTIPCPQCGKEISSRRMDIHLAVEHKVNVSKRPGGAFGGDGGDELGDAIMTMGGGDQLDVELQKALAASTRDYQSRKRPSSHDPLGTFGGGAMAAGMPKDRQRVVIPVVSSPAPASSASTLSRQVSNGVPADEDLELQQALMASVSSTPALSSSSVSASSSASSKPTAFSKPTSASSSASVSAKRVQASLPSYPVSSHSVAMEDDLDDGFVPQDPDGGDDWDNGADASPQCPVCDQVCRDYAELTAHVEKHR